MEQLGDECKTLSTFATINHADINHDVSWTPLDTDISKENVSVLEPARIATEHLSNQSINLLVGEGILKFLLEEVSSQKAQHSQGNL
jgi:hypothetical protein